VGFGGHLVGHDDLVDVVGDEFGGAAACLVDEVVAVGHHLREHLQQGLGLGLGLGSVLVLVFGFG